MKPPARILIVKADRISANSLERSAHRVFANAEVQVVHRLAEANAALSSEVYDLLVCGIELPDGDMIDLLSACLGNVRRVRFAFVVTTHHEFQILESLRLLPIDGLLDAMTEGLRELELALHLVASGTSYWSRSIQLRLQEGPPPIASCRLLTPTEQIIFSVLGDGCDDEVAAMKLGLKAATINSARREIHRKLKIQHRGDLVRLAVENGFVRLSAAGTFRPAFATMLSACVSRKIPLASREVTLQAPSASCVMLESIRTNA